MSEPTADAPVVDVDAAEPPPEAVEPAASETPEPSAEEGEASPESGEKPAPKGKVTPALAAAIRLETKAKAMRAEAEAKVADVSRREQQLRADVTAWETRAKAWEQQVQPKLQRLQAIDKALQSGDYTGLFETLGADPKRVLDGLAGDLSMPDHVREELAQARRDRTERQQREQQEREQREQQQKTFAENQALWERIVDVVDANPDGYAQATRFARDVGADAFVEETKAIRQQMGGNVGTAALLREIERRARIHYGNPAPQSGSPSQVQGPGKPATPAAHPATPMSRRPVGVSQRAAQERASEDDETDPVILRRRGLAVLREGRQAS
jgi:hypothetical protein